MSAESTAVPDSHLEAIDDPDAWRELSHEEQSDALAAKHAEESRTHDDGVRDWDAIDNPTQEDTLAAIQQSLDETWTAECFAFDSDSPTVPFEVLELTEAQQDTLEERAQLVAQVEEAGEKDGVETADDLKAELGDDAAELFDSLDDLDAWLNQFMEDITAGDHFTAEWWADGGDMPAGLRLELFFEVFTRYNDRMEAAQSFRQNRAR